MIEFKNITEFPKRTLYNQLVDTYSFNKECQICWDNMWKNYDEFFYTNEDIANKYGFVTVVDGNVVGHITWDPRNRPDFVEIGHNLILTKYKGNKYGKFQLQEAIRRIKEYNVKRIIVTTNELLLPAQKNYESVGFKKIGTRVNNETPFTGNYIDYEMVL